MIWTDKRAEEGGCRKRIHTRVFNRFFGRVFSKAEYIIPPDIRTCSKDNMCPDSLVTVASLVLFPRPSESSPLSAAHAPCTNQKRTYSVKALPQTDCNSLFTLYSDRLRLRMQHICVFDLHILCLVFFTVTTLNVYTHHDDIDLLSCALRPTLLVDTPLYVV